MPINQSVGWAIQQLRAEGRAWAAAVSIPAFHLLLALLLLALLLIPQLPFAYIINVGKEEGYQSDLPHLQGFNTAESDIHGSFRWTRDGATVTLPGLGQRPMLVQLHFFPINAEMAVNGPQQTGVWSNGEHLADLPVRPEGAYHRVLVPVQLLSSGTLHLTLRTETYTPPGDPRQIGTPLDRITVTAAPGTGMAAPDWSTLGAWLLAALFFWVTLLRALESVPHARKSAIWFFAGGSALVVLAALLDLPRWAFGAQPALVTLALCYLLVLVLRLLLPALAARFAVPLDARALGWLLLIIVVAFGLRYGGRLYPRSMHGDIGFHTNRFHETMLGTVYLLSRNRGIDFPYPPGPYLTLAPLILPGIATPDMLQLSATLADSLGAALVFAMVVWIGKAVQEWHARAQTGTTVIPSQDFYSRTGLLAAALYVFTAAGFMTNWWSFSTHIYAQFSALLLVTARVPIGLHYILDSTPGKPNTQRRTLVLGMLMAGVFLGHFGFFINIGLLLGLLLIILWVGMGCGAGWARRIHWPLLLTAVGTGLVALLLFYSAYLPLFLQQAQEVTTGGLTGLADRMPVGRGYLWEVLWYRGLITHFGFFPLLLAPLGMLHLTRWGRPALLLVALMAGSFLVSALFALLPFITLSTQSTRWLMFSAWAVAVGAAVTIHLLWRCGRAGRLVVLAMGGVVLWNTAMIWLGPLIWRIRPPEPF